MRRHAKAPITGSTQAIDTRRGFLGIVCLCVLGAAALLGTDARSAGAAVDPCPNAEFRIGLSAELPNCRAYEKITPSDKGAGQALLGVAFDNNHAYFEATAAFLLDDTYFPVQAAYVASRDASGWGLRPGWIAANSLVGDLNADFTQDVIIQNQFSAKPLLGTDTDLVGDVYVRDHTGLRQVSVGSLGGNGFAPSAYAGQSLDGSHVLFQTTEQLELPDDETGAFTEQLYERFGNQTRVVGVLPEARCAALSLPSSCVDPGGAVLGAGGQQAYPTGTAHPVSDDGSHVFFTSPDPAAGGDAHLYLREDGQSTVQVSATQCDRVLPDPPCEPASRVLFQGASADGSKVFFSTPGQLVDADTDSVTDLYGYDADTGQLSRITNVAPASYCVITPDVPCGFRGMSKVSEDGLRVYFAANGLLTPDASPAQAETNFYLYDGHTDTTTLVAPTSDTSQVDVSLTQPAIGVSGTPDGGTFVFQSTAKLTDFDNAGLMMVYRFEALSKDITCVSCNTDGHAPLNDSKVSALFSTSQESSSTPFSFPASPAASSKVNRFVSNDGSVVLFESIDNLVPGDTNEIFDAYLWHAGHVNLLTSGHAPSASQVLGLSPDGQDAFFLTRDQLVPTDLDASADLYDARVDGGLAADHPAAPALPCSADGCHGPVASPPSDASPSSSSFSGPGNAKPEKPRCGKGKIRNRGRCVAKRHSRHPKGHRADNNRRASR